MPADLTDAEFDRLAAAERYRPPHTNRWFAECGTSMTVGPFGSRQEALAAWLLAFPIVEPRHRQRVVLSGWGEDWPLYDGEFTRAGEIEGAPGRPLVRREREKRRPQPDNVTGVFVGVGGFLVGAIVLVTIRVMTW